MDQEDGYLSQPVLSSTENFTQFATSDSISKKEMAKEFVRLISQHNYLQLNFIDLQKEKDQLQQSNDA